MQSLCKTYIRRQTDHHMTARTLILISSILLVACTAATPPPTPAVSRKPVQMQTPISELDTGFLYLAAEQAIQNNKPALAIRFLAALLSKDKSAILPRLHLAELFLQHGQVKEAQKQVDTLLDMHGLEPEIEEKTLLLHARILTLNGKHADAIQVLKQMLKKNPESFTVRMMLIRLMEKEGRFDEAHQMIREGIKLNAHIRLYHIDAELYIRQGKLKKARRSLETLRKLAPNQSGPVLMLSRLALRQGDVIEAEEVLRKFLAGHPRDLSVSNALGRLLVQQKRGREAIAIYEDISRKIGENTEVLTALGLLYYQQRDYRHAADRFRQALGKHASSQARFYLAASLEAMGKKTEAEKIYRRIKHNSASYTDAQLRLAAMDLQAEQTDVALSRIRAVIRENPEVGNAYALLSSALLHQKKYRQLLVETEIALGLPEVSVQLLFNRAAAFEGLKQYEKAAGQIKKLFIVEPDNIEALNFLGYLYAEQGIRLDEAEKLILRALKQKPGNGYYLDSLAWVYYKRGEYDKALSFQRKAVDKIQDDPVMQEHLGDILWRAGKPAAARDVWKKALRLGHEDPGLVRKKIDTGL
ncbi:MAG: tetratricopeptide repeat protein [Mariprofundaceae bacterium]|nr:tetratricopeptide repeat protein [Mariprofundaceae bacterium]